ncbi:MAG: hypothetical protein CL917_04550 [Deltaproteobacteria bacterium]|nr:hypothetical protein [Deltaproteobacteria bacterium]
MPFLGFASDLEQKNALKPFREQESGLDLQEAVGSVRLFSSQCWFAGQFLLTSWAKSVLGSSRKRREGVTVAGLASGVSMKRGEEGAIR